MTPAPPGTTLWVRPAPGCPLSADPPLLRWGLVFLACPLPLSEEQKLELVRLAASAYFGELGSVRFDHEAFSGEVRATSGTVALGSFVGQAFEAEVHVPHGSGLVKFLVTEAQLTAAWGGPAAEA